MVVCRYFQQGYCKFGPKCRNEHPGGGGGGGFASQNRFGALSGNRFGSGSGESSRRDSWNIQSTDIATDLSKARPQWILSAYGPGKNPPGSLLQSNEFSPEEIRVRFYELASQGKADEADKEAIALWNKAEQDIQQILNNPNEVIKFMEEADRKHPNRDDLTKVDGTKSRDQIITEMQSEAFTSGSGTGLGQTGTGFGQSSTPKPFAKPAASAFGQPPQSSAFGSSSFGQSAFGQSGFASGAAQSSSSSAFGRPSSGSAFGKPAFGSGGFGQSSFGQPAQPSLSSQPSSPFGQPSQTTSTFGQPSQPLSGFGQPAFGASGFGSSAQKNPFAPVSASTGLAQTSSTFGQPSQPSSTFGRSSQPASTFGQTSQPASTFGQPSQPSSTFGQPTQPTSTFGQPSAFSKTGFGEPTSTFGQPSQPTSGFGQASPSSSSPFRQAPTTSSGFGQPSQPGFGQSGFGVTPSPAPGQTSASVNPFGTKPAEDQPNDQTMETTSPGPSRPASRANPFVSTTSAPPPSTQPMQPTPTPSQPPTAKPILNTSMTPHPLTGRPPHAMHYTQTLPLQPSQMDAGGRLTSYRGHPVSYIEGTPCYRRPDGKGIEKIWFPDAGATLDVVALNREDKIEDCQGWEDEYTDAVKDEYKHLFEKGNFKDGRIPLVPPLREWGIYDF